MDKTNTNNTTENTNNTTENKNYSIYGIKGNKNYYLIKNNKTGMVHGYNNYWGIYAYNDNYELDTGSISNGDEYFTQEECEMLIDYAETFDSEGYTSMEEDYLLSDVHSWGVENITEKEDGTIEWNHWTYKQDYDLENIGNFERILLTSKEWNEEARTDYEGNKVLENTSNVLYNAELFKIY